MTSTVTAETHPGGKSPGVLPAFLILCTALCATSTLLLRGNSCGHDFDFHLLSWMEVARAWQTGLAWPHWVQDANFGAGEPRLIFYPPASWLLGGLLGSLSPWHVAPTLFVLVALLASGWSMYFLAREWVSAQNATFAACLYVANPYAMFVAYERTAFGELLAAAWLPLLLLFALRRRSSVAPLGLSVAALWLTNSPAAVLGSYLLAFLALGMSLAEKKAWPATRAAVGVSLGLGLAAFYIVPAAFEQRWVQIERAITPGMRAQDSFLFAHTANAFHDQVLHSASWIFVAELAFATVTAWLAWKNRAAATQSVRLTLTATLPIMVLLQLPVSELVWRYTPHMKFLQFPWRWLMALSVVACGLGAMALTRTTSSLRTATRTRWAAAVAGTSIAALAIGGGLLFFQPCDDEDAVAAQLASFQQGEGTQGTDEYTPVGTENTAIARHLPLVRFLRDAQDDKADSSKEENSEWLAGARGTLAAAIQTKRWNEEHWAVHVVSTEAGFAVLRLLDYPSWRVAVDGISVGGRPTRQDGLMAVPVHAGSHAIEVRWSATSDVLAGRAISAISLLGLLAVALAERKSQRKGRV